jgi:hypothetical protein
MTFSGSIRGVSAKIQKGLETRARSITREVFSKVVLRTPVDSGKARANWNVSVGTPDFTVRETTSIARAFGELNKVLTIPVGSVVYLSNGVPYIRLLEYGGYPKNPKVDTGRTINGFSSQAPQGMVRITMAEYSQLRKGAR